MLALFLMVVLIFIDCALALTLTHYKHRFVVFERWMRHKRGELTSIEDNTDPDGMEVKLRTIDESFLPFMQRWQKHSTPHLFVVGAVAYLTAVAVGLMLEGVKPEFLHMAIIAIGQTKVLYLFHNLYQDVVLTVQSNAIVNDWVIQLTIMDKADQIEDQYIKENQNHE